MCLTETGVRLRNWFNWLSIWPNNGPF